MKRIYATVIILVAVTAASMAQAQQWDLRLESVQYAAVANDDPLKPAITPAGDKVSGNIVLVFTATPVTKQEWKERILVEIGKVPDVAVRGAGCEDVEAVLPSLNLNKKMQHVSKEPVK
jgi:hypothetical protein